MATYDPRIDDYISRSADFAKPLLNHLRKLVHIAEPEIEETMKWSSPHFDLKGSVCSMASFKNHCSFGFWKSGLLKDHANILKGDSNMMGKIGDLSSLKDLPPDEVIISYIREAVELNKNNMKLPPRPVDKDKNLTVPDYFSAALNSAPAAKETFEKFSYSGKKEYVEWITEAKSEATREKRMATALEWLAEGKSRHWKYKNC